MIIHTNTYCLQEILSPAKNIFLFDIETTGLSSKYHIIYMIGMTYIPKNQKEILIYQGMVEHEQEERQLLTWFLDTQKSLSIDEYSHFNGQRFDIPFIIQRLAYHQLDSFTPLPSFDLLQWLRPFKNIFSLKNIKQKSWEALLGIQREDKFSGGELIEHFHAYTKMPSKDIAHILFLHNYEDILGMIALFQFMPLEKLWLEYNFKIHSISYHPHNGIEIKLILSQPFPFDFHIHRNYVHLGIQKNSSFLTILLYPYQGRLFLFHKDYQNYYYLPAEDMAIHKSLGEYVDRAYRKKAKASNCYTPLVGDFIPAFDTGNNLFYSSFSSKEGFIPLEPEHLKRDITSTYLKGLLDSLL